MSDNYLIEVQILRQLIEANKQALAKINGQDIVILIGKTGAGKSTTMNYLAGIKLVEKTVTIQDEEDESYDLDGVLAVADGEQEIAKIGYLQSSETQSLITHSVDIENIKIILCDSPGFQCTDGWQVDIANSIGLVETLYAARSVKILLLMGYKSLSLREGRGQIVRETIETFNRLIINYEKSSSSIMLGFTHLDGLQQIDKISSCFKAIKTSKNQEHESINKFSEMIYNQLMARTQCCLIDPLDEQDINRIQILKSIQMMKPIDQKDSKNHFQYHLSFESKSKFSETLNQIIQIVEQFLQQNKHEKVYETLEILIFLREETKFTFVNDLYKQLMSKLIKVDQFKQIQNKIQLFVSEELPIQNLSQQLSSGIYYLSYVEIWSSLDISLKQNIYSFNTLLESISVSIDQVIQELDSEQRNFRKIRNEFEKIRQLAQDQQLLNDLKQACQRILKHFKNQKQIFQLNLLEKSQKAEQIVRNKFSEIKQLFSESYENFMQIDSFQLNQKFSLLKSVTQNQIENFDIDCSGIYEQTLEKFKKLLDDLEFDIKSYAQIIFEKMEMDQSLFQKIQRIFNFMEQISQNSDLISNHFKEFELQNKFRNISSRIIQLSQNIIESQKTMKSCQLLSKPYALITQLEGLTPALKDQISSFKYQLNSQLKSEEQRKFKKFTKTIDFIENLIENSDIKNEGQQKIYQKRIVSLYKIMSQFTNIFWETERTNIQQDLQVLFMDKLQKMAEKYQEKNQLNDQIQFNYFFCLCEGLCVDFQEDVSKNIIQKLLDLNQIFMEKFNQVETQLNETAIELKNLVIFEQIFEKMVFFQANSELFISIYQEKIKVKFGKQDLEFFNKDNIRRCKDKLQECIVKQRVQLLPEINDENVQNIQHQKQTLDNLQIYAGFNFITQEIDKKNYYNEFLNRVIKQQQDLQIEINNLLSLDSDVINNELNMKLKQLKLSKSLYESHLNKLLDYKYSEFKGQLQSKNAQIEEKINGMICQYQFQELNQILINLPNEFEQKNQIILRLIKKISQLYDQLEYELQLDNFQDQMNEQYLSQLLIMYQALLNASQIFKIMQIKKKKKNYSIDELCSSLNKILFDKISLYFVNFKKFLSINQFEECNKKRTGIMHLYLTFKEYLPQNMSNLPKQIQEELQDYFQKIVRSINLREKQLLIQIMISLSNVLKIQPDVFSSFFQQVTQKINELILKNAGQMSKDHLVNSESINEDLLMSILLVNYKDILNHTLIEQSAEEFFSPIVDHISLLVKETDQVLKINEPEEILKHLYKYDNNYYIINKIIQTHKYLREEVISQNLPNHEYDETRNNLIKLKAYSENFKNVEFSKFQRQYKDILTEISSEYKKLGTKCISIFQNLDFEGSAFLVNLNSFVRFTTQLNDFKIDLNLFQKVFQSIIEVLQTVQKEIHESISKIQELGTLIYLKIIQSINEEKIQFENEKLNLFSLITKFSLSPIINQQCQKQIAIFQKNIFGQDIWKLDFIYAGIMKQTFDSVQVELLGYMSAEKYHLVIQLLEKIKIYTQKVKEFFPELNCDLIFNKVEEYYDQQVNLALQMWQKEEINDKLFKKLEEIQSIENKFQDILPNLKSKDQFSIIIKKIEDKILAIATTFHSGVIKDPIYFTNQLVSIRSISFEIGQIYQFTNKIIKQIIEYQFDMLNDHEIHQISCELRSRKIGALIIQEHSKTFERILNEIMRNLTKDQFKLDYIIDNIKGDEFHAKEFAEQIICENKEENLIYDDWMNGNSKSEKLLERTLKLMKDFTKKHYNSYCKKNQITWSSDQKTELIKILAHVCAVWSVIDCQGKEKTKRLHAIQIATIMRLLAIDTKQKNLPLESHIIQIKTGEGKSITLGIMSIMLAFLGFEVNCCCYSDYLSQRDYDDFKVIFSLFKLKENIIYSTFDTLFEKLINSPYDLRKYCQMMLDQQLEKHIEKGELSELRKKVLLIDEVDFFFGDKFLGEIYPVALNYNTQDIIDLFKIIWTKKYEIKSFESFQSYPEYITLYQKNPGLSHFKKLVDTKIALMISDVKEMETHQYSIYTPEDSAKKLICYKQLDGISLNTVKGYKTAFAYVQEWEKKVISEETMNENLSLMFNVGCYSFAEIPKSYFLVLGVSGTLDDMNDYEKEKTVQIFGIKKKTISPSIYGESKLKFDPYKDIVILENQESFYKKINDQIQEFLTQNRSILIFFDNKVKLDQFYDQIQNKQNVQILTEETSYKDHVIKKVGSANGITLATKPFGRGCDFMCLDPQLIKAGGLHVIQTFLSLDKSEETQIKGRTARQTQKGSYFLILSKEDLQKQYKMDEALYNQAKNNSKIPQFLETLRDQINKPKQLQTDKKYNDANHLHKLSEDLRSKLVKYQQKEIQSIIEIMMQFSTFTDKKINKTNQYNFYNINAGKIGIGQDVAELDQFNNPLSTEFDLGVQGQFAENSILIGLFYTGEGLTNDIPGHVLPQLKSLGYTKYEIVTNEQNFILKISEFDQAWIISSSQFHNTNLQNEFVASIKTHLSKRRGLMIWADNTPFVVHANLILQHIPVGIYNQQPIHIKVDGCDYGDQILDNGSNSISKQFGPHLLTSGLNHIHEGITICSPQVISNTPPNNFGWIEIIGLSSAGKPCIFVLPGTKDRGRIIFDCGFTKLMKNWWDKTAGTTRYVRNSYAWLFWKEKDQQLNA